ncbi:MAG: RNA-binding protein [Clostridiales bacterium]|nr:RNA-binding protein [Clostridiales bacterium]
MLVSIGSLVISKNGRDKDKYFLVVKIEDDYVYLCDGDMRKVDNPKKKKQKHIQATKYFSEDMAKKIHENVKLTNRDIKDSINEIVCKEVK